MSNSLHHTTVLLNEAVDALFDNNRKTTPSHVTDANANANGTFSVMETGFYVDGTFGRGGHSRLILSKLPAKNQLHIFDKDPQAIASAEILNATVGGKMVIHHQSFKHIADLPAGSCAGILLDLGVSSPQIDSPERGFSFRFDATLDMRMDTTRGESVAQWLLHADVQSITNVLRDYGEERMAYPIAQSIVAHRDAGKPVQTTFELVALVSKIVKTRDAQNPATRTFQAFRIFINAELDELQMALDASLTALQPGGRLVVIAFHSLEDRIVKQFLQLHGKDAYDRRNPFAQPKTLQFDLEKRTKPNAEEIQQNPRSRSAVMRVAIKK